MIDFFTKSSLDALLELHEVMQRSRLTGVQADTGTEISGGEGETGLGYGEVGPIVLGERRWRCAMGRERAQTAEDTFRVGGRNRLNLRLV